MNVIKQRLQFMVWIAALGFLFVSLGMAQEIHLHEETGHDTGHCELCQALLSIQWQTLNTTHGPSLLTLVSVPWHFEIPHSLYLCSHTCVFGSRAPPC